MAAVAADSLHDAEEAVNLIEVEYELLPPVTTVEEAMADGAPLLHPEFKNNVASHSRLEIGDVEKGFEEADIVIEREFRTKTVHQGYIEPHSATAWWTPQDRITVWGEFAGAFPDTRPDGCGGRGSVLVGEGGSDGDRRRFRREDDDIP